MDRKLPFGIHATFEHFMEQMNSHMDHWTSILKACEEAVRRKNGHGSDAKAEEYGYGYGQ